MNMNIKYGIAIETLVTIFLFLGCHNYMLREHSIITIYVAEKILMIILIWLCCQHPHIQNWQTFNKTKQTVHVINVNLMTIVLNFF